MNLYQDAWLVFQSHQQILRAASPWLSRLRAGVYRIGTAWAARLRRARDARALYAFSDRDLWDLGLSRSDIATIIEGTYRRG